MTALTVEERREWTDALHWHVSDAEAVLTVLEPLIAARDARMRAEEREACALLAAKHSPDEKPLKPWTSDAAREEIRAEQRGEKIAAELIAKSIRARKETP